MGETYDRLDSLREDVWSAQDAAEMIVDNVELPDEVQDKLLQIAQELESISSNLTGIMWSLPKETKGEA